MGSVCAYGVWIGVLSAAAAVWGDASTAVAAAAGLFSVERETAMIRTVRAFLALRQTPLRARATLKAAARGAGLRARLGARVDRAGVAGSSGRVHRISFVAQGLSTGRPAR